MRARLLCLAAASLAGVAQAQGAPKSAPPRAARSAALVECGPRRVRPGNLCMLVIPDTAATEIAGSAIGEPLHFSRDAKRRWVALVPVPVDSTHLRYRVSFVRGDGVHQALSVVNDPLLPSNYPTERLTVAPTYGTKPDSATQARIDAEGKRSAEVSKASHETPRLWTGAFVTPRPGRVTSSFGRARVFNGEVASRHMGTDFAGAVGAPVKSANRGVVRIVDRFFLGGNVIYIDHGGGLVTAYLHLSQQDVAVGDTVEKGQVIGNVGATGRVTGPHLHLIARYGGVTVDPMSLLAVTRGG